MGPFTDFDCSIKYRYYENNIAYEYDAYNDATAHSYIVRQEYDLRLYCTWTSKG